MIRRAVTLAVLGALLVGTAGWVVFGTSVLGVREIIVNGSRITTGDEVRAAAAVAPGTALLLVDTGEVEQRVRALPPVAQASVRRSLPHTLVITVTERTPAAVAPEPGGFAVLSADGVAFQHVASPPAGIAVLRVGSPGADDPATLAGLRVLAALTPPLRALLAEVVAPSPTGIFLALTDGRRVIWGDAEGSDLKATVATALLGQATTTIDVTVPEVATVS